jgi:hypothetical protein
MSARRSWPTSADILSVDRFGLVILGTGRDIKPDAIAEVQDAATFDVALMKEYSFVRVIGFDPPISTV